MVERIFIIDSHEPRLDAATARRQFSLSVAVGLAVLATAAIIQFQPAQSAPVLAGPTQPIHARVVEIAHATPTQHIHAQVVEVAQGAPGLQRN